MVYYTHDSQENPAAVGLVETTTDIANHTTTYLYDNQRRLTSKSGATDYPVGYSYDDYGALHTMTTWRTEGNQATAAVTTWAHDEATGLIKAKYYQDQSEQAPAWKYEYHADGRLSKRTSLRGIVTDYDYTDFGDLESVTYSNDSNLTPDVTYAGHDRLGRPRTVTKGGDEADLFYDEVSGAESIAYDATHSALPGVSVMARVADAAGRPTGFNVLLAGNNNPIHLNTLDYDPAQGRLDEVDSGAGTTSLSWYPGSDILKQAVTTVSGNVVRRETRVVDVAGRITGVHTSTGSGGSLSTVAASGYTLDALGCRTTARREDGSTWTYDYNDRSEVTSGRKKLADMTTEVAAGLSFDYLYDDIGNRRWAKSGGDSSGQNQRQISYTPNALNQYSAITNPRSLDVLVRAPDEETVTVTSTGNTVVVTDQDDWRRAEITSSSNNPQWVEVDVSADAQTLATGEHLWLPAASVAPDHDADGNLTDDGRWAYTWDAENRLVAMQRSASVGPNLRLEFRYDHRSRRIAKKIIDLDDNNAVLTDLRFAYDGWNLVAEFKFDPEEEPEFFLLRSYTWGLDLSNTLQGAGGVGGLLAVRCHSPSTQDFYPAFDGNGNVIAWSDSSGTVLRRIDYDPFGNVTTVESAATAMPVMPVGFSTKYTDGETGLVYYIFRYYDPVTGRWPSRDPIAEEGGPNSYVFVANDGVNQWDNLGLIQAHDREAMLDVVHAGGVQAHKEAEAEYLKKIMSDAPEVTYREENGGRPFIPGRPREYGGMVCERCKEDESGKVVYTYYLTTKNGSYPIAKTGEARIYLRDSPRCNADEGDVQVGWWHTHPSTLLEDDKAGGRTKESRRYRYYWAGGKSFSGMRPDENSRGDVNFFNGLDNPDRLSFYVTYRSVPSSNDGWRYYTDELPGGAVHVRSSVPMKPEWIQYKDGKRMPSF